jgi:ElaB/YqjD/DUF883 family membrane-anchored ribosome-binding protein
MAQRAENFNFERANQSPAPIVQFPSKNQLAPGDNLARVKKVATDSYRVMQDRASRSYLVILKKSNALATGLKRQIRTTREEHPLRIVAIAAGTAFVLGIVLRVWRNGHE